MGRPKYLGGPKIFGGTLDPLTDHVQSSYNDAEGLFPIYNVDYSLCIRTVARLNALLHRCLYIVDSVRIQPDSPRLTRTQPDSGRK